MRVLRHEILINIVNGKPVPNLFVYPKPWYRDAATMCMCLKKTGNLHLVEDWILGLKEPFDRNNDGDCEPDRSINEYSAFFWMDFREDQVDGPPFSEKAKEFCPYLGWAEAHFHGWPPPMEYSSHEYPVTWEAHASQADYDGMALISEDYVNQKVCAPHAWHSAEMFLYLVDEG